MIPEERLSVDAIRGQLLNPWSRRADISYHWGPVALNDPSQGMLVQLWTAIARGTDIYLRAPNYPEALFLSLAQDIEQVSLAFDQNGQPFVAFVEGDQPKLHWYDPAATGYVTDALAAGTITPRLTLDDARTFQNGQNDVILAYVRGGVIRYRQQRDRFQDEYTPPLGAGGSPAAATGLRHVSINSVLRLEFMTDSGGEEDWTLPQVIEDLATRANLPPERQGLKLLDWNRVVRGYMVTNAYGCYSALQHLSQVFLFDPFSANGKVQFAPRGRDAALLIPEDDLLDDGEDIEHDEDTRRDSMSIPRVLHLNYYDVNGGLHTAKQFSERPEGARAEGSESLDTAVVLTADEAATCVNVQHLLKVEQQKGELNFRLTSKYLRLTESDVIHLPVEGRIVRGVIARVRTADGEQAYQVLRDRQSLYGVEVEGIPVAPPARPPSSVAGPTLFEFLDIATLRDSQDQLGFRVAVAGIYPAWPGAHVDLSLDGGENYIQRQSTRSGSVIGALVTALGAHPAAFPDEVNSCEVAISTPNALLVNTSLVGMLNRTNRALIGDEIVNFADGDEVTPGIWAVSHWLRGRKGTAAVEHLAGERFVLLDTALFVPAELSWLNRTLTFRATTIGRPIDEATVTSVTFIGRSQTERQPAYLQARRDGTDAVIAWQGVGRLGGGASVAMGAYFLGFRVTLSDGSTTETHDTLARALTTTLAAFTGPVTVRVQQRNQFTGLGPYIEVTI